jgi:hypothetical protein
VNQAARTALLAAIPTLDDVNIALVQRGDRGGVPAGDRVGGPAGGFGPAPAPSKGKEKQVRVVLDDDEVSYDEDAPLQKRVWLSSVVGGSSGSAPAMADVAAAMKAAVDKEVADKRAAKEATMNVAADKEAADKRVTEVSRMKEAMVGAVGDSSAPG